MSYGRNVSFLIFIVPILTLIVGLMAVAYCMDWANMVAGKAIGAIPKPLRMCLAKIDISYRTDFLTQATSRACRGDVERLVTFFSSIRWNAGLITCDFAHAHLPLTIFDWPVFR